jgi:hypothetical protein
VLTKEGSRQNYWKILAQQEHGKKIVHKNIVNQFYTNDHPLKEERDIFSAQSRNAAMPFFLLYIVVVIVVVVVYIYSKRYIIISKRVGDHYASSTYRQAEKKK